MRLTDLTHNTYIDKSGKRRDPQLKLAVETGAESGLRISETCNLRLADVDVERHCLFVRLPTKTRVERYVPFHRRTREALIAWLKARPAADHDFLFVGADGRPLRRHTLRKRLNQIITGPNRLKAFSYHRLRHTAASTVYPALDTSGVMKTFGWKSHRVAQGYTKVDAATVRDSYIRAMESLDACKDVRPQSQSIEAYFVSQGAPK